MKKSIVFLLAIILFASCLPEAKNKHLTYQNIVILSDMSDRIEPFINSNIPNQQYPPKDIDEIRKIIQFFKNECVKPGEKIGDKSSISFSPFSGNISAIVDVDQIKSLGDKQQFVNSTGQFEGNGLAEKLVEFENSVISLYDNTKNKGLDLISILIEKIENGNIVKENTYLTNGLDTTFINYDNHIYIFTDGYLEYWNANTNRQFYFSEAEIKKVRQYCIENKTDVKTALEREKSLTLPSYQCVKSDIEFNLHILETHERDFDNRLNTYKNPKGLRDNEILEAVWRKWAKDSGFKSFDWKKF
ncbi:hypothetical protein [Parabacteroides sp. PF5-9]|uniref:hypothetical protein n=1 Tax=Parabacteroides sp. PF5-9 TaxID=1742404 RepID=UPI002476BE85|nr:hypothetical protein [Parabacteroides sp. PF5-9]MDH6357589.1 hypothetical protein [Parabacteroides sp. PF5-9]